MKTHYLAILLALLTQLAPAEQLTPSDKETLLERLENISNEANNKVDARFRAAQSAFKNAINSDEAAIDLYLKCAKIVNFEEQGKDSGDFREWKKKNRDTLTSKHFRAALRQQLRWLSLTLDAASADAEIEKLAIEAARILESIMSQAEELAPFRNILQENVTSSVFAKTYEINEIKAENWAQSPTAIETIFENIILPPLRRPDRLPALRAAWENRIKYEGIKADYWSGNPNNKEQEKLRPGEHSPEYDQFVIEELPHLSWKKEIDLFKNGAQRTAAVNMLTHIEKNLTHKSAPEWAEELTALLAPEPIPEP